MTAIRWFLSKDDVPKKKLSKLKNDLFWLRMAVANFSAHTFWRFNENKWFVLRKNFTDTYKYTWRHALFCAVNKLLENKFETYKARPIFVSFVWLLTCNMLYLTWAYLYNLYPFPDLGSLAYAIKQIKTFFDSSFPSRHSGPVVLFLIKHSWFGSLWYWWSG